MALKDWKKISATTWENKYRDVRVRITVVGNSEFAMALGMFDAKPDKYAVVLETGTNVAQYHLKTYNKIYDAIKVAKNYMRTH